MNSLARIFVAAGVACSSAGGACAAQRDGTIYPARESRALRKRSGLQI
jgi:hypothetical protein